MLDVRWLWRRIDCYLILAVWILSERVLVCCQSRLSDRIELIKQRNMRERSDLARLHIDRECLACVVTSKSELLVSVRHINIAFYRDWVRSDESLVKILCNSEFLARSVVRSKRW